MEQQLLNISPVDGRYKKNTEEVSKYFSEYNLIKNRIFVEIEWLKKLLSINEISNIKINSNKKLKEEIKLLDRIVNEFNINEAKRVKEIENTTKHDVKAVEYYIDEKLKEYGLEKFTHLVHFACTSEDINNLAYGVMENELVNIVYIENINNLLKLLKEKSKQYASIAMLSHTHGQNATPTTVGKEMAVFAYRIEKMLEKLKLEKLTGKFNGTVGNFNAHIVAYPNIDWIKTAKEFVESFNLEYNMYTTQIESHDNICSVLSRIKLLNNVILDLNNDMWMYISRDYFLQNNVKGEVGSSVMPHKINPINFENSMANVKMANAIINVLTENLQVSRMQRDLSDSSLQRNIGMIIAYSLIAIKQTIIGINKLTVNKEKLLKELTETPEVLAEAVQTILRKNGYKDAYEILKGLTRGKHITMKEINEFIKELNIESNDKKKLLNLKPSDYVGLAEKIAKI